MEISGIGSSFDPAQMAANFFKKADANGDGGIDKSELKAALSSGPNGGKAAENIDSVFAEADSDGDGKINQTENTAQMAKMKQGGGAPPAGGAGGKPAGGAPHSGGKSGGTSSGSSATSSSSAYYDKMDANKDGSVSSQEKIAYEIKHHEERKNPDGYFSITA